MTSSNSWFSIDSGTLNLSSIASKVSNYVKESPLGDMAQSALSEDPRAYKKKHDDQYTNHNGFEEIEDLDGNAYADHPNDFQSLYNRLRIEHQQLQIDLNEQLSSRDSHIKALEAQLVQLRQSQQSIPPSVTDTQPSKDAERAALLQEKLNKAVSHLKPLMEENRTLSARMAEKEAVEEELRAEIQSLILASQQSGADVAQRMNNAEDGEVASQLQVQIQELESEQQFLKEHAQRLEETLLERDAEIERLESLVSNGVQTLPDGANPDVISSLRQQVEELKSEQQFLKEHAQRLEETLLERDAEIEHLTLAQQSTGDQKTMPENPDVVNRLQQQLQELESEQQFLKDHAQRLEETLLERDAEIERLEAAKESDEQSYQSDIEQLKEKMKMLAQKLKESLEQQQQQQSESEEAIQSLQNELEGLRRENAELVQSLAQVTNDTQQVGQNAIDEMMEKLTLSQKTIHEKENDLSSLQSELERLSLERGQALADKESEINKLKKRNEELSEMLMSKDSDSNGELQRLISENAFLQEEIEHMRSDHERQLAIAKEEYTAQLETLNTQITLYAEDIEKLNQALKAASEDRERDYVAHKNELTKLKDEITKLENSAWETTDNTNQQVERLQSDNQTLLEQNQSFQSQLQALEERLHSNTAEHEKIVAEYQSTVDLLSQKDSELAAISQQNQNLLAELEVLRQQLEASGADNTLLSQKEMEVAELSRQLLELDGSMRLEVDSLRDQLESAETKLRTSEAQLAGALNGLVSAAASSSVFEVGDVSVVGADVQQLLLELGQIMSRLRAESAQKTGMETSQYEQMLADLNTEVEEKSKAYEELHAELNDVSEERDRLMSERALLMEKLTTVKNTFGPKLQGQIEENNQLREHVESLQQTISSLREERELINQQMTELSTSSAHLQSTTAEYSHLQEQLASLQIENEKLSRRLAALQQHLAESEEAATEEALKAESLINEYRVRIESLEREREDWELMSTETRQMAKEADVKLIEAREAAEAAREELEEVRRAHERDQMSLANLQTVLNEFQASKDAEMEFALQGIRKQLQSATASLEEYRRRALDAEEKLESVDLDGPGLDELKAELQERSMEVGKLRARDIQSPTSTPTNSITPAANLDNSNLTSVSKSPKPVRPDSKKD
ncbi:hypothetical protein HDV05_006170 [Chytridiales sp. JEL 0842]|nr:hypothetical protein HDV05_006170 [Chytridiales sp. JEL 0842]